jgi:hypothetical protein
MDCDDLVKKYKDAQIKLRTLINRVFDLKLEHFKLSDYHLREVVEPDDKYLAYAVYHQKLLNRIYTLRNERNLISPDDESHTHARETFKWFSENAKAVINRISLETPELPQNIYENLDCDDIKTYDDPKYQIRSKIKIGKNKKKKLKKIDQTEEKLWEMMEEVAEKELKDFSVNVVIDLLTLNLDERIKRLNALFNKHLKPGFTVFYLIALIRHLYILKRPIGMCIELLSQIDNPNQSIVVEMINVYKRRILQLYRNMKSNFYVKSIYKDLIAISGTGDLKASVWTIGVIVDNFATSPNPMITGNTYIMYKVLYGTNYCYRENIERKWYGFGSPPVDKLLCVCVTGAKHTIDDEDLRKCRECKKRKMVPFLPKKHDKILKMYDLYTCIECLTNKKEVIYSLLRKSFYVSKLLLALYEPLQVDKLKELGDNYPPLNVV